MNDASIASLRAAVEREQWADENSRTRYLRFLRAAEWAEHCVLAGESRSSRASAVLQLAEALEIDVRTLTAGSGR